MTITTTEYIFRLGLAPGKKDFYIGTPGAPFRPLGLVCWGVDVESIISDIQISSIGESELLMALPAQLFTCNYPFSYLEDLAKLGRLQYSQLITSIGFNIPTVSPSDRLEVTTKGNFLEIAVYGILISGELMSCI